MVGRIQEKKILNEAYDSDQSELIAIYGRRRIGKTYLVREHFANHLVFETSGLFNATLSEQLRQFASNLKLASNSHLDIKVPTDWFEAFEMLKIFIINHERKTKKVIFLDEVPWMATAKSRFLTAFEGFWNGWASARKDLVIIICGSASSWMIQKIEKSKGGLYNRVTQRIVLKPFTLAETELFFQQKNIVLNRRHITELYMGLGGVPHYLNQIRKDETPEMALSRLILNQDGLLFKEFENLFISLFGQGGLHQTIVEILAKNRYGLTRETLLNKLKLKSGGWFSTIIEELETSGFIEIQTPFGKKSKEAIIKIIDNYSLYYINFRKEKSTVINNSNTQEWKVWSGLSFENICMYHAKNILKALGLNGMNYSVSAWYHKGNEEMQGAQIDMVIDRADKAINICEIKFNEQPFIVTKKYANDVRLKMATFNYFTKNKKTLFCTFITSGNVVANAEAKALIQKEIVLDDLFGTQLT
jgi:hypothetical protein